MSKVFGFNVLGAAIFRVGGGLEETTLFSRPFQGRMSWVLYPPSYDLTQMDPSPARGTGRVSRIRQEDSRVDVEEAGEIAYLRAIESAFARRALRKLSTPGCERRQRSGLSDRLLLDQETKQVGIAERGAWECLCLIGLHEIAEHVEIILLGGSEVRPIDERIDEWPRSTGHSTSTCSR